MPGRETPLVNGLEYGLSPEKTGNVLAHLLSYLLQFDVHGTMEKAGLIVGVPMASALGPRLYYSNDH